MRDTGKIENLKRFMVSKSTVELDLLEKLEPVLAEIGYECRDIDVVSGANAFIRVTIDRLPKGDRLPEGDGKRLAISIEDCSKVHRVLGPMFDVWDPLEGAYSLEMSSPGETPPLRMLRHFQEAVGNKIRFQTTEAIEVPAPAKPRRKWEGTLDSVSGTDGILSVTDTLGTYQIPISLVKNALWLREWTVQDIKNQEKKL